MTSNQESVEELRKALRAQQRRAEEAELARRESELARQHERQRREEAEAKVELSTFRQLLTLAEAELYSRFRIEPDASRRTGSGSTKVSRKLCPATLQRWHAFPDLHSSMFQQLEEAFGDRKLFETPNQIEYLTRQISPDGLKNEVDLHSFIRIAIEVPAKSLLQQFFQNDSSDLRRITFRNTASGLSQSDVAEADLDGPPPAKRQSPEKKPLPDRWGVVVKESGEESNCFVGEFKSAHRLQSGMVRAVLGDHPGDDFFAKVLERKAEWRATSQARASRPAPHAGSESQTALAEAAPSVPARSRSGSPSPTAKGEVQVAMVLCQTFHYMIRSGLACGYVASGSALIFLHVPVEAPTVLQYFPVVFTPQDAARDVRQTAVSYLSTFSVFAARQAQRSSQWIKDAETSLQTWTLDGEAQQPRRTLLQVALGGCGDGNVSLGGPGDDSGSEPDSQEGLGNPSSGGRNVARGRSLGKRRRSGTDGHQPTQPTQRGGVGLPAREARGPQSPTRPFCTQACLSGLRRCGALDVGCPNAALHAGGVDPRPGQRHRLTAAQVCEGIYQQLDRDLGENCACREHMHGATSVMFKLTLTGYGYTFVGKGSPAVFRTRLEEEEQVYEILRGFQGSIIPVCLGLVHLAYRYALSSLVDITDMLLLSWAGEMVDELDDEAYRTQEELEDAGLVDEDFREANVTWNEETGRAMRIDLGGARVMSLDGGGKAKLVYQEDKENQRPAKKARMGGGTVD